jgi:hypothetical protein
LILDFAAFVKAGPQGFLDCQVDDECRLRLPTVVLEHLRWHGISALRVSLFYSEIRLHPVAVRQRTDVEFDGLGRVLLPREDWEPSIACKLEFDHMFVCYRLRKN